MAASSLQPERDGKINPTVTTSSLIPRPPQAERRGDTYHMNDVMWTQGGCREREGGGGGGRCLTTSVCVSFL